MLEIKNLTYKKGTKLILDDINLKINEKETIALTGPNGSGKSTLAKIIIGLYKPTRGKILFNNEDITNLSVNERANLGLSYAFQNPIIFNEMTVYDLFKVVDEFVMIEDIKKCLSKVGLCTKEYIDRKFDNTLSGGERKRIELAIILFKNAKLNILDEPEAGIDLWGLDNLTDIFKGLKAKTNIIITHQEKIMNLCDKVIVLKDGKISSNKYMNKGCCKCMEVNNG